MEKDFRLASKKFWQTVRQLRKGKQRLAQAVFGQREELLTQTEDIVRQRTLSGTPEHDQHIL